MKTPDEIKKGLAACSTDECHGEHVGCTYNDCGAMCIQNICADALALIQQLERERDAAINDMLEATFCPCNVCTNHYRPDPNVRKYRCKVFGDFGTAGADEINYGFCGKFEWRGV